MCINSLTYTLPTEIKRAIKSEIEQWTSQNKVARVWTKDASLWTNDDEAKWLGWLDIVDEELVALEKYSNLQKELSTGSFKDVLLMGMGGSSLCPEVLAMTFGKQNFHILDSTVPLQVKSVEDKLDLEKTLFIVASKSGSTLEPNCFKQYFFERVAAKVGRENAGKQFIAITDPGSKMDTVARDDGFRHIFYGNPQIGGRFSALSAFGMIAAASMGMDVEQFLRNANEMVDACRNPNAATNPGAVLGAILGICHKLGRDKLTIFTSPEIHDLGAWLEQLIAESTGKIGVSIIPVDREPVLSTDFSRPAIWDKPPEGGTQNIYGNDRVFAFLSLKGNDEMDARYSAIAATGHPAIRIDVENIENLGQEFFRWEFATAVAGSIIQINPFNQPDVESAKIEARKITDEYEKSGRLPDETPFFQADGVKLFSSEKYAATLTSTASDDSLKGILEAHLQQISSGDYFAVLGFIQMNAKNTELLQSVRGRVLERFSVATCLGFGPRFLHSTGQAYKGGANNGVFLQITSDDAFDIQVPGQKYTFGTVKSAQARGDFQVLIDRGRRALRVHLTADVTVGLEKLLTMI